MKACHRAETAAIITKYERQFAVPVTDPLANVAPLAEMVLSAFPQLQEKLSARTQ